MGSSADWVHELFVEKGELYLRVLNRMWGRAYEEALSVRRLLDSLGVGEGSLILDLGCGNGRIAVNLAKLGYRVVGVDISPVFIRDAEERAKLHGVEGRASFRVGDARRVDEELGGAEFDAVLLYWSTVLGYYDELTDADILRRVRRVTRSGGYLLVLNTVSFDTSALRAGLLGTSTAHLDEVDEELVYIDRTSFDPVRAVLSVTRTYYRRAGRDLVYVDEASFRVRVYTLHELVKLAEGSGWEFVSAYQDISILTPYRPLLSRLNVVFRAV